MSSPIILITAITIGLMYLGFLAGLALLISRKLTMPPRQKQKKSPMDYGLSFNTVELTTAKGYRIRGWIVRPQGVHKGTLVICHNYRASKQKVLPWIRFLCGAGYEAVAFDFNGHGDSDRAHSWWGAVEDTVLDLETVLGQLGRLPSSNSSRVGLLGFSMGAMSVFGYLSLHADQNNIGAVIIDSGPPHPKVWYSLVDMSLSPHFRKLPGIRLVHHLVRYWQRFERTPQEVRHLPLVVLNLEVPFLFIHGLKDNICPPEESRWICDHLTRAPKEYWAVPEARHLTNLTLRKREYQQRVLRFLDRFLAGLPVGRVENHHEEAVVQDRKGGVL